MANAKKCDRCGKYYDIPQPGEIAAIKTVDNMARVMYIYDLCPRCREAIMAVLEAYDRGYVVDDDAVDCLKPILDGEENENE